MANDNGTDNRKKLTADEAEELAGYIKPALERHVRNVGVVVPGFTAHFVDTDVSIPTRGGTLKRFTYHTLLPSNLDKLGQPQDALTWLWVMDFRPEDFERMAQDDGSGEFEGRMMAVLAGDGKPLKFEEMACWLAIHDAEQAGDEETARRIHAIAYERRKHARKSKYARKQDGNTTVSSISLAIGPLTNALAGRNDGAIPPAAYFTDEAVTIKTGNGGTAEVDVRASEETAIDAAYREYRINDRDRFWLDALYTLALDDGKTSEDGKRRIDGSEILKLRGYANPYAENSASTMEDAYRSISKANSTRIAIDLTNERRNKRRGRARIIESVRLQHLVEARIIVDRMEVDGEPGKTVHDFTVELLTPEPLDSLPVARYERERGMFTTVAASDFDFATIKNLTTDDRQMWSYVLRTLKAQKLRNTILFETMWRNLELREPEVSPYAYVDRGGNPLDKPAKEGGEKVEPENAPLADEKLVERRRSKAVKSQRDRMLKKLERMLDEKQAAGKSGKEKDAALFYDWRWSKDAGGRIDGIKIRAKRGGEKY